MDPGRFRSAPAGAAARGKRRRFPCPPGLRAKLLALTRVLPATALLLVGSPQHARAEAVHWQDAMGREVAIELPARSIVSLAPSVTETLFALGAGRIVTGVSKRCDFPVEAKLKPKMGEFNTPDLAAVTAAAPDVVLFAEYARQTDLDALARAGIPALVLPARSVADVIAGIARLGALAGRAAEAERLAAEISLAAREVGERLAAASNGPPPRVYIEVDGPEALYAVGPGSFMDDIVRLAGGKNVFADRASAYFAVQSREVIAANPEVILVDYPFQYKVGVSRRPGWDAVAAVRNARVYDGTDFDIILFNRPGPRIARSLREIARLLHPGVFRER